MIDVGVPVVIVDLVDRDGPPQETVQARECPICAALVSARSVRRHELWHLGPRAA